MANQLYKVRGTKITLPYPPQLTPDETRLAFRLQRYFDPDSIFPELYLPHLPHSGGKVPTRFMFGGHDLRGSEVTQIDCLAISRQGVFVFESKDYTGYIFGNGNDRYWTQVTQYGKAKYRFYNPLRQNKNHILSLQDVLSDDPPIYSLVVFGVDATLKSISDVPENAFVIHSAEIAKILQGFPQDQLTSGQVTKLRQDIQANRLIPTPIMRRDHAQDIAEALD